MGIDRQIEGEGDATLSALNFQIRHSKGGHKSRENSPRPPSIWFTRGETIRIDSVSHRRAAGEQEKKGATTAESEWFMSSVEKEKMVGELNEESHKT